MFANDVALKRLMSEEAYKQQLGYLRPSKEEKIGILQQDAARQRVALQKLDH